MNSKYTYESLMAMTFTDLRAVAAQEGVPSPTNKTKDILARWIIDIQEGLKQPVQSSGRGRPPKQRIVFNPPNSFVTPTGLAGEGVSQLLPEISIPETDGTVEDGREEQTVPEERVSGILEIMQDGYGFLRTNNFYLGTRDIYVPMPQIRRFSMKAGDKVECTARTYDRNRNPSLIFVHSINDVPCDRLSQRRHKNFDELIPAYPDERIKLENASNKYDFALRAIDLISPIGKGQRGLIVSPPKAGKTVLLKKIAQAISANYPDIHVVVLLVDERPEEVTDFKTSLKSAEIVSSTFDQGPVHHIAVTELVFKNAKRRVEFGQDVVILMDSITRLGRAYNQTAEQSGRTLTGGLDISALQEPKRLFGSARKVSEGGSLTVLATALVDTGSRMDDIIYEEFKGTGNMEIHLDRKLSEKRIFPAIDLNRSGTRREDLLLSQDELEGVWTMRKILSSGDTESAAENLLQMLVKTSSNAEFIEQLKLQMRLIDKEGYTFRGTGLK